MVHVPQLRDGNVVTALHYAYEQAAAGKDEFPPFEELTKVDQAWLDELARRNNEDRVKLEVELKTYTSNMIKESIRVRNILIKCLDITLSEMHTDGVQRLGRILSDDWRLSIILKAVSEAKRRLHDESACVGHVSIRS